MACLALCAAVPNFGVLGLSWRRGMSEVIRGGPKLERGYLIPGDEPGLEVHLDEEACAAYPVQR